MINKISHWTINKYPSVYDNESLTTIELVARVTGTINDLIDSYNEFVDQINEEIGLFENNMSNEQDEFKEYITQIMHEYIHSIDTKIDEAINYMKTNIESTTAELVNQLIEEGQISVALDYTDNLEELDMIITNGGNE